MADEPRKEQPPWAARDNALPAEEWRRGWAALAEWNRQAKERVEREKAAGRNRKPRGSR